MANSVKAENRERKLNSILEDKDYTEINIEETKLFELLSDEDKEKWIKNGKLK